MGPSLPRGFGRPRVPDFVSEIPDWIRCVMTRHPDRRQTKVEVCLGPHYLRRGGSIPNGFGALPLQQMLRDRPETRDATRNGFGITEMRVELLGLGESEFRERGDERPLEEIAGRIACAGLGVIRQHQHHPWRPMLHHIVLFNRSRSDSLTPGGGAELFGGTGDHLQHAVDPSGSPIFENPGPSPPAVRHPWELQTVPLNQLFVSNVDLPRTNDGRYPDRYFYWVGPTDDLMAGYHLHNEPHGSEEAEDWVVAVRLTFFIDTCARHFRDSMAVTPLRFDVLHRSRNPGEFSIEAPDLGPEGDGSEVVQVGGALYLRRVWTAQQSGWIIIATGHLHYGGRQLSLWRGNRVGEQPNSGVPLFWVDANYIGSLPPQAHHHVYWIGTRNLANQPVEIIAGAQYTIEASYMAADAVGWYTGEHDLEGAMGLLVAGMVRARPRTRRDNRTPTHWDPDGLLIP